MLKEFTNLSIWYYLGIIFAIVAVVSFIAHQSTIGYLSFVLTFIFLGAGMARLKLRK
jgi:hypothetical protein